MPVYYSGAEGIDYYEDELAAVAKVGERLKITVTPPALEEAKSGMVTGNDLSYGPEGQWLDRSQDASVIDSKPRTDVLTEGGLPSPKPEMENQPLREKIRQGAKWIQENTGIGKESFIKEIIKGIQKNGEVIGEFLSGQIDKEDPRFTEAIVGLTADLGLGGVVTAPLRTTGLGILGGRLGAKTLGNEKVLEHAAKMHAEGKTPAEIFKVTGSKFDPVDGMFKFEIPDAPAKLLKEPSQGKVVDGLIKLPGNATSLPEVLDHPWLYKTYPELKNIKIFYNETSREEAFAWFHPGKNSAIEVSSLWKELEPAKRTAIILHEIQHYVQTKEKFFSNLQTISPKFETPSHVLENLSKAEQAIKRDVDAANDNMPLNYMSKLLNYIADTKNWINGEKDRAFNAYWNSPREAEARLVEQRYLATKGLERDY